METQTKVTSILKEDSELAGYLKKVLSQDMNPYTAALGIIQNKRFWELLGEVDNMTAS